MIIFLPQFVIIVILIISASNQQQQQQTFDDDNDVVDNFFSDELVNIDVDEQEKLLREEELKCNMHKMFASKKNETTRLMACPKFWDKYMCWPETPVNTTVYLNCPLYIDQFVKKNKANKTCVFNGTTAIWEKTQLKSCMNSNQIFVSVYTNLEIHLNNMLTIRIIGYVFSITSLMLSILIMTGLKRLRCPRNYVHINLFFAFGLRTILTIVSKEVIDYYFMDRPTDARDLRRLSMDMPMLIFCRSMVSLFRYAGAVYDVAIFSEALYLVLLLKYPFYSEKRGFKFCIIICWLLPLLWLTPWLIARLVVDFDDDYSEMCWQTESPLNLILKIPQSIFLFANLLSAGFIIRVLYAKLNTKISREKVMKYRRLAKSIFILIPIFGLHFILFAWLSYATDLDVEIQLTFNYIEAFFMSFQGFVVSITCCFIQRDVRIETHLFMFKLFKRTKCYEKYPLCCKCCAPDYVSQLRNRNSEQRMSSLVNNRQSVRNDSMYAVDENLLKTSTPTHTPITSTVRKKSSLALSTDELKSTGCFCKCLEFLFDKSSRNDFYQHTHGRNRTSSNLSRDSSHRKTLSRNSSSPILPSLGKRLGDDEKCESKRSDSCCFRTTSLRKSSSAQVSITCQPTPNLEDDTSEQPRQPKIVKFEIITRSNSDSEVTSAAEAEAVAQSLVETQLVRSPSGKKSNIKASK